MRKYKIIGKIFRTVCVFAIISSLLLGSGDITQAGFIDSFTTILQKNASGVRTSKGAMIRVFCKSIKNQTIFNGVGIGIDEKIKPRNSIFLYIICRTVGDPLAPEIAGLLKADKLNKILDFTFCNPGGNRFDFKKNNATEDDYLRECNMAKISSRIFTKLMNEYSNLKLASLYGYKGDDIEKAIGDFSRLYYGKDVCKDPEVFYLFRENLTDPQSDQCTHPKTYNLMKDYITKAKRFVSKMDILDIDEIFGGRSPVFTKAFSNEEGHRETYQSLVYTELMMYNLFMTYMSYAESNGVGLRGSFILDSGVARSIAANSDDAALYQQELGMAKVAVPRANRVLANVYSTFPVHIGLMAYWEDVYNFRYSLARVFTPLHQLHYKLRNVQEQ